MQTKYMLKIEMFFFSEKHRGFAFVEFELAEVSLFNEYCWKIKHLKIVMTELLQVKFCFDNNTIIEKPVP